MRGPPVTARKPAVTIRIGGKRQITLPREAARRFGLGAGDELEARILDDRIELRPMVSVPKAQAWFWSPEWQAREREAEQARQTGRYRQFRGAKKLIAGLRKK
ncbi:MAG: AbrB/MazE/SpoVT family DNA-binding domain-containing protein [Candidatus Acidiferrales bacterium]